MAAIKIIYKVWLAVVGWDPAAGLGPLAGLAEALAVRALALVLAVDGAASGALAAAAAERCPELQPVIIAALAKASA